MFDNSMRMLPIIIAILKLLFTEQNVQRYTFVHIKIIEAMGKNKVILKIQNPYFQTLFRKFQNTPYKNKIKQFTHNCLNNEDKCVRPAFKRLKRDTTENGKITINSVIIIKNNKTKLANIPDFMLELQQILKIIKLQT